MMISQHLFSCNSLNVGCQNKDLITNSQLSAMAMHV